MKPKIVVTRDLGLYDDQAQRLGLLGEDTCYNNDPASNEEWLERCQGADIICTGMFGLKSDRLYELKNVFISLPFVGVEFLDLKKLKDNNITVSNSPGCNKEAVAEWIIGMILMYFRRLYQLNRVTDLPKDKIMETGISLYGKTIAILGAGNIGQQLGRICESFGMLISYFRRGDDLIETVKNADVVANCLSVNQSTIGLLDQAFFSSLKKGAFFVSSSRHQIYDIKAMIEAIDKGILIGAADDAANAEVGNTNNADYQELLAHPQIFATPHIAWNADIERRKANDIMIDNIESWLNNKPINLIQ